MSPANYYGKSWLVDDGLPHNTITRVVQDQRAYLWIASSGGLTRFDGRDFRDYPLPVTSPEASFTIRDVAVEKSGALLMLPASGGMMRFENGGFLRHPASGVLGNRTLLNLFIEPQGAVWLGTGVSVLRWEDEKLRVFDQNSGLSNRPGVRYTFASDSRGRTWIGGGDFVGWYRNGQIIPLSAPAGSSISIAPARSGGIWIASAEQLLKWDEDGTQLVKSGAAWGPGRENIQQLFEDSTGALWISTRRQGLFRLDDEGITPVPTSHQQVNGVAEDTEGNLWVATDGGGVTRLRRQRFVVLNAGAGFPDDISVSVTADSTGALWCASRNGQVVRYHNGEVRLFSPEGGDMPAATGVCADHEDNIWVGTDQGLYLIPAGGVKPMRLVDAGPRPVRTMYVGRNGDMWVAYGETAGDNYRLARFHEGKMDVLRMDGAFFHKHVIAIAEDTKGSVWISASDGELLEYRDGKFSVRVRREASPCGRVDALYADERGGVWLGGVRGLVLMEEGRLQLFTRDQGLPDDLITQILEDEGGRLWLCTRRGFFSVAVEELKAVAAGRAARVSAITFGREEGLPGISAPMGGHPKAWRSRDGLLWFATNRGVVGFDPAITAAAQPPLPAYIDQVLVDEKPVPVANPLQVPPRSHQVEFRFSAPTYAAPEKVRFRYQLVGFDPGWIEAGGERSANYVRLPPGGYTLRVVARHQAGVWPDSGSTLAFVVLPAWWQRWWARGFLLAGFTGIVVWLARYWSHRRLRAHLQRLEHEHALEKERARIARDLHDDLGGSLTQIGLLADRLKRHGSGQGMSHALGQLAWRTRRLAGDLESIVWTVSPKNNTLDRLAAFIAQYVIGFCRDTSVRAVVHGEETIPAVPVAPDAQHHLLAGLKEALNNVLKHAQAKTVTVTMTADHGEFVLQIADDGIGFDPAASEHSERNGLNNMRTRVAEMSGRIEIISAQGRGAKIVLRLPLPITDRITKNPKLSIHRAH
ncbi:MAG: two-component regulator propeller domain-containing protein [Opitutaceae bacterium]